MSEVYVLLDHDGVINNGTTNDIILLNGDPSTPVCNINHRLLTKFFDLVNAKIVLISAWGLRSEEENQLYIDKLNYKHRIVDNICDYNRVSHNRVAQILHYLDSHPEIDKFIIIDDEFSEEYKSHPRLMNNYHKVNPQLGFTMSDILMSLDVLYKNTPHIISENSLIEFKEYLKSHGISDLAMIRHLLCKLSKNLGSELKLLKFENLLVHNPNAVVKNLLSNCMIKYYHIVLRGNSHDSTKKQVT